METVLQRPPFVTAPMFVPRGPDALLNPGYFLESRLARRQPSASEGGRYKNQAIRRSGWLVLFHFEAEFGHYFFQIFPDFAFGGRVSQ